MSLTCARTHTHTHTQTHPHAYTLHDADSSSLRRYRAQQHTNIQIHMHARTHACTLARTHARSHACTHARTLAHTYKTQACTCGVYTEGLVESYEALYDPTHVYLPYTYLMHMQMLLHYLRIDRDLPALTTRRCTQVFNVGVQVDSVQGVFAVAF